jgi:hypothetical protein
VTEGPSRKDRVAAALCYGGPICVIVYLYAGSEFVKKHGRWALSVFVMQVMGLVVVDLFRPLIGPWVLLGWGVWLILTAVLQVTLAAGVLAGKA